MRGDQIIVPSLGFDRADCLKLTRTEPKRTAESPSGVPPRCDVCHSVALLGSATLSSDDRTRNRYFGRRRATTVADTHSTHARTNLKGACALSLGLLVSRVGRRGALDSIPGVFGSTLLFRPRTTEDIPQAIVAFVTGVLENRFAIIRGQWN